MRSIIVFILLCIFSHGSEDKITKEYVISWAANENIEGLFDAHGRGTQYQEFLGGESGWHKSMKGWEDIEAYINTLTGEEKVELALSILKPRKNVFVHAGTVEALLNSYSEQKPSPEGYGKISISLRDYITFKQRVKEPQSGLSPITKYCMLAFFAEIFQEDIGGYSPDLNEPVYSNKVVTLEKVYENRDESGELKFIENSWDISYDGEILYNGSLNFPFINTATRKITGGKRDEVNKDIINAAETLNDSALMKSLLYPHSTRASSKKEVFTLYSPPPHDKGATQLKFSRYQKNEKTLTEITDEDSFPFLKDAKSKQYDFKIHTTGTGRLVIEARERHYPHARTQIYISDTVKNIRMTQAFSTNGVIQVSRESDEIWIFNPKANGKGELGNDVLPPAIPDSLTIYDINTRKITNAFERRKDYSEPQDQGVISAPLKARWELTEELQTPAADKKIVWHFFQREGQYYILEASFHLGWEDRWAWNLYRLPAEGGKVEHVYDIKLEEIHIPKKPDQYGSKIEVLILGNGIFFMDDYGLWKMDWSEIPEIK